MREISLPVAADRPTARARRRRLLQWLGTGLLLAATAYFVNLRDVWAHLRALDPMWVGATVALTIPLYLLHAWRWWFTANRVGAPLTFRHAFSDYYLSTFLNQVLPVGVAGDAARALRHRERLRAREPAAETPSSTETDGSPAAEAENPPASAAGTPARAPIGPPVRAILLERLSGQAGLALVMCASAIAWISHGHGSLARIPAALAALVVGAIAVIALAARRRIGGLALARLVSDGRAALVSRGALPFQLAVSSASVGVLLLMYYGSARAAGVHLGLAGVLEVVPLVLGATALPIAFSGWGIREVTTATLYGLIGLAPAAGVAMSVTFGVLSLAASAPGLVVLALPTTRGPGGTERGGGEDRATRVLSTRARQLVSAAWMLAGIGVAVVTREPMWLDAAAAAAFAARIAAGAGAWTPSGRFGAANTVTLVRLAAIALLPVAHAKLAWWQFITLVLGVFALDGVDGFLARRRGEASPFGAAFDMETDAFLMTVLPLLLWLGGAAGVWVLAVGLWRYASAAFVALFPARRDAPRSRFGRVAFGASVSCLCGAFLPLPGPAEALAAVATALISLSFARSLYQTFRAAPAGGGNHP